MLNILTTTSSIIPTEIVATFLGAFFAFFFFVIGQAWILSMAEKKQILFDLRLLKEYIASQIFYFEINLSKIPSLSDIKPISISIVEFGYFPIKEDIFPSLSKFDAVLSVLKFMVYLRALNDSARTINTWIHELSNLSKVAILEEREDAFKETMEHNLQKLRIEVGKFEDSLKDCRAQISTVIAEIALTENYVNSYFWKKLYVIIRKKISPLYWSNKISSVAQRTPEST